MKEQINDIEEFLKVTTTHEDGEEGHINKYNTFNDFKEKETDEYLFMATDLYWVSKKEEEYFPIKVTHYGGNGYRFYLIILGSKIIIAIKTALSDGTLKCLSNIRNLEDLKLLMKMNNILNSTT